MFQMFNRYCTGLPVNEFNYMIMTNIGCVALWNENASLCTVRLYNNGMKLVWPCAWFFIDESVDEYVYLSLICSMNSWAYSAMDRVTDFHIGVWIPIMPTPVTPGYHWRRYLYRNSHATSWILQFLLLSIKLVHPFKTESNRPQEIKLYPCYTE